MLFVYFFIIFIFFLLSAFFSGIETGLISLDKLKLEQKSKKDQKTQHILDILKNPDVIFGTTLFGNNISVVIVSSISMYLFNFYKKQIVVTEQTATLIIAGLILVFAELIPKALYRDYPNKFVLRGLPLLKFFSMIFWPFVKFVSFFNNLLAKVLQLQKKEGYNLITREDLSYMLAETKDDEVFQSHQKQMLEDVLEFTNLDAENVMIHRTEIIAFEQNTPIENVIKIAKEKGYTRFPVYRENLDNIVGILIIYDLLKSKELEQKRAADFMRNAYFTPENKDVNTLLKEMQENKISMTIVVDSFGGTAGLITIEDILEEIVGEIEDEYDISPHEIEVIKPGKYIVQGFVEVDYLNDDYDMGLPVGDYETIAGLIIDIYKKIPQPNTEIKIKNWKAKILQATEKKILKIELQKMTD